jgi:hypothetical protein
MAELKMDELLAAVDLLKNLSPEEREAVILALEHDHPGIRRLIELEERKVVKLRIVKPVEEAKPEVRDKYGNLYRWVNGGYRRALGVAQLKVTEQAKPEPEPEAVAEPVEGEVIKPGLVEEIGRLELELAEKKAHSLATGDRSFMTPGMAAKKPVVVLNEFNKKHAVITNLGGKCVVMEWAVSQVDPRWVEPSYQKSAPLRKDTLTDTSRLFSALAISSRERARNRRGIGG